jgi:Fe-S cluster biogenesis protein NfuA
VRSHAKASTAGSTERLGGAFRPILLILAAAVFLLVPAAQAAAQFKVDIQGTGSGTVLGGTFDAGTFEENGINCSGPPPTGECEVPMSGELFFAITEAEADPGSEFVGWTGCTQESGNTCSVETEEAAFTVTATFAEASDPSLTIDTSGGSGSGEVECEVGAGPAEACESSYAEGTELTLVPSADPGSEFAGFEGGTGSAASCTGTSPCTFTLAEDSEVDAPFDLIPRSLTINVTGEGEVQCKVGAGSPGPCAPEYADGTQLTLVPSADPGSEFTGFSNGSGSASCTGTSPCAFTIKADSEVDADFDLEVHLLSVDLLGAGEGSVESSPSGIECEPDCEEGYDHGTMVTLSQSAEVGSKFEGWSGCDEEISGDCVVEMDEAKNVTATFSLEGLFNLSVSKNGTGSGTVTSAPAGINCGGECNEEYLEGTDVVLTGTPDANNQAVVWTGCDSVNGEGKCLVDMTSAKGVTATFNLVKRTLTVMNNVGTGTGTVTSSPAGINCGADCTEEFDHGAVITLTGTPGANSQAVAWSGCEEVVSGNCKVTMSAAKAVTATFNLVKRTLTVMNNVGTGTGTVTSSPAGINCGADCTEEYDHGTEVTLTAVSGANTKAVAWSGCASNPTPSECKVTMSAAKGVTATFDLEQRTLTVSKSSGSGTGTVTSSPSGISCGVTCAKAFNHGTVVTLTPTPTAGTSVFVEWTGACTGTGACQVTMDAAKSVDAKFDLIERTLTINKAGSGSGSVTCNGGACAATYPHGTKVTLAGSAASGSTFAGFSGGGCSGSGSCEVTLNANTTITATFNAKPSDGGGGETTPPPPSPPPNDDAALGQCVKQANAAYRKALKAARKKQGKAKAKAIKAAKKRKAKAIAKCKQQFG